MFVFINPTPPLEAAGQTIIDPSHFRELWSETMWLCEYREEKVQYLQPYLHCLKIEWTSYWGIRTNISSEECDTEQIRADGFVNTALKSTYCVTGVCKLSHLMTSLCMCTGRSPLSLRLSYWSVSTYFCVSPLSARSCTIESCLERPH